MGHILSIPRDVVAEVLTIEQAIELMKRALVAAIAPEAVQPPRSMIDLSGNAVLGIMPGATGMPPVVGAKVTAVFPEERRGSLPSHQGLILLFDAATGAPRAVLNGAEITLRRTAAVSAVATLFLAGSDATSLLIVGTGEQAWVHMEALSKVGSFQRILIWGRRPERAAELAAKWNESQQPTAEPAGKLEAAVRAADVVCTVTAARTPILCGGWVKAGMHLNMVGSSDPGSAEVDDELVAISRLFVDRRDAVDALGGEWRNALESGRVGRDHIVSEIGDVIAGRHPGRIERSEITMFKSVGLSAEDLVAADWIAKRAAEMGLGQELRI